ncbi:MAG: M81 family metallopeptidase, partial [Pseudomonadota bacterium]
SQADETAKTLNGYGTFVRRALADGHETLVSSYSFAQPSAPMVRADYENMRDEILDDLKAAGGVDMVLFFLHGAQMAQGYDDCEGDLIARARAIAGPGAFIGALLDLHANVTPGMLEHASALVACRFYPHTDFDDRASHLYDIAIACVDRGEQPHMHYRHIPMLTMHYTTEPGMSAVNEKALALQNRPNVLSVSLIHGFQWADITDIGAGVLTVTLGQVDIKSDIEDIAQAFFENREETRSLRQSIETVLDHVEAAPVLGAKTIVIADVCDNPGGGAGSDSTFILADILRRNLTGYGVGIVWDPIAAQFAAAAGQGAEIALRLGGKTGPLAGDPLDVNAKVLCVRDSLYQLGLGYKHPMGLSAALEVAGNVVLIDSIRGQVFNPSCFTDLGVEPRKLKAVVVKSTQHFYDHFEDLASEVLYCDTPGSLSLSNMRPELYSKMPRPMWPIDAIEAI